MGTLLTGAEAVEWNLSDLYDGPDDPRIESELDEALAAAQAFRERYRGKLGELSAAELNDAVAELERIKSVVDARRDVRPASAGRRQPPTRRAARSSRRCASGTRRSRPSSSSSTSSGASSTTTSPERLLADPALERYASVLRSERRYKPYQLTEPEERISAEKSRHGLERLGPALQRAPLRAARLARRRGALARRGARRGSRG